MKTTLEVIYRDQSIDDDFYRNIQARFLANVGESPLFTTDAVGLFDAYLSAFSEFDRQYHNCNACCKFFETYGSLVTIDSEGRIKSALWDLADTPEHYKPSVRAMLALIKKAKVTGVFLSDAKVWGQPTTGDWSHYSVVPPVSAISKSVLYTPYQLMAEKGQNYLTINRALNEFCLIVLDQVVTLLESESLYRSEKILGPAKWLQDLQATVAARKGLVRSNLIWRAVATAPAGFCHPRSSMIGTLLEDVASGSDFADASRRFTEKMNPTRYQRPQAAPTEGNIAQAERIVDQLGIRKSLERRYARLDEIQTVWRPREEQGRTSGGVFSGLIPKGRSTAPTLDVPPTKITWEKFARTVLPNAEDIWYYVTCDSLPLTALVTAVHPEAPLILQWDNPVSWYVYSNGSPASRWNLTSGQYCKVSAVSLKPSMWGTKSYDNQGKGVILILDGAKDEHSASAGLFPEILKSELHSIRSTIEAYSRNNRISGREQASACGLMLANGATWNAQVRVKVGGTTMSYTLERWD